MSAIETEFTVIRAQAAAIEALNPEFPRQEQIRRIKAVLKMLGQIGAE